jgi:hypothetical protein
VFITVVDRPIGHEPGQLQTDGHLGQFGLESRETKLQSSEWLNTLTNIKSKKDELNNKLNLNSLLIIDSFGTVPALDGTNTQEYYNGVEKYNKSDLNSALELLARYMLFNA